MLTLAEDTSRKVRYVVLVLLGVSKCLGCVWPAGSIWNYDLHFRARVVSLSPTKVRPTNHKITKSQITNRESQIKIKFTNHKSQSSIHRHLPTPTPTLTFLPLTTPLPRPFPRPLPLPLPRPPIPHIPSFAPKARVISYKCPC